MTPRSDLRTHTIGGRPLNLDAPRLHPSQLELLLRTAGLLTQGMRTPAHWQRRADLIFRAADTSRLVDMSAKRRRSWR